MCNHSKQYRHILLATNGSEAARNAEEHALLICTATGAKLTVLCVMDDNLDHYGRFDTLVPSGTGNDFRNYVFSELQSDARQVINRFGEIAEKAGADFDVAVRQGNPSEEIVKASFDFSADLVVIGCSKPLGRLGLKKTGTSDKVAAGCNCRTAIIC